MARTGHPVTSGHGNDRHAGNTERYRERHRIDHTRRHLTSRLDQIARSHRSPAVALPKTVSVPSGGLVWELYAVPRHRNGDLEVMDIFVDGYACPAGHRSMGHRKHRRSHWTTLAAAEFGGNRAPLSPENGEWPKSSATGVRERCSEQDGKAGKAGPPA